MNNKVNADTTIWDAIKDSIKNLDARSVPGLLMFLALIAIESGANMIASLPDFGWIISVLVALLFGVFIGAWHIITERERNSVRQQSIAEWSVKVVGGMSIGLFIVNLIRLASGGGIDWNKAWYSYFPTNLSFGGWDVVAILIIAAAFGWHLFNYINWHENDKGRQDRRAHAEKMSSLDAKENSAALAVRRAEVELMCLEAEENKVKELRERFKHLDKSHLDRVLREARIEIRNAFEKKYNTDLDGDGKIGDGDSEKQGQMRPAYTAPIIQFEPETRQIPPKQQDGTNYTLKDLERVSGLSVNQMHDEYKDFGRFESFCKMNSVPENQIGRLWGKVKNFTNPPR